MYSPKLFSENKINLVNCYECKITQKKIYSF